MTEGFVISLRKFLEKEDSAAPAFLRVVQLLIQGMGLHAIKGDCGDYEAFRESVDGILALISAQTPLPDFLVHAGAALNTLEEYNRRTARYLHGRNDELQKMVKMLTSAISHVVVGSDDNLSRLREIEQQVVCVSEVDDIRLIKDKLAICLGGIRQEVERQKEEKKKTLDRLRQNVNENQPEARISDVGPAVDPVTGLRGRAEAERALEHACYTHNCDYAAVIVIENMQAITIRFGYRTGDEVLQCFGDHIVQLLQPEDAVYRWSGPTLLATLRRTDTFSRARERFGRLMEPRFEHTVTTPSRIAILPLSTRWELFSITAVPRLLIQKIDAFVSVIEPAE